MGQKSVILPIFIAYLVGNEEQSRRYMVLTTTKIIETNVTHNDFIVMNLSAEKHTEHTKKRTMIVRHRVWKNVDVLFSSISRMGVVITTYWFLSEKDEMNDSREHLIRNRMVCKRNDFDDEIISQKHVLMRRALDRDNSFNTLPRRRTKEIHERIDYVSISHKRLIDV